ncbi:MAG: hypothetical protein A2289_17545 [Deltaproteobacteria bacterium RIFOXYA12_FULL_58_15]|nr:MAG: hypothetical protein A2289_17545 [Deltaproteobacteria bacterium RIFOXYA12_FULL_58_15]
MIFLRRQLLTTGATSILALVGALLLLWGQSADAQPQAAAKLQLADPRRGAPPQAESPEINDGQPEQPGLPGLPEQPSDSAVRPVEAKAWVDKAVATTGDIITYTVEISYDSALRVELPEPGADIAGLRILDFGGADPQRNDGKTVERRWYKLRADLVGSYVLPPVKVHYTSPNADGGEPQTQTIETSQIFIEVASVLPADGDATDIRDVKPLFPSKSGLPWWTITAGAIGVAALLAGLLYWRMRRKRTVVVPQTPAYEIAFAALDALRQTDFDDLEAVREYYFRISEVLRAYIEGTFHLNATDLTTEEILPRLLELPDLGPKEHVSLGEFLRHTDRVKFSEHSPSPDEIERAYEHALGFVETTMPQPQSEGSP